MRLTSEYPDAEVGLNHPRCYHWDEAEHEGEDWGQQEAPPLPLHQALLVVDEGDALRCDHNVTREIMQWHVTYIGGRGLNITSHLHCKLLVSLVHVKSESNKICFGVIFTSCKCHAFFRNQSIPAQLNTALAPWEYHTALNITLKMIKWCVTGIMIILKTIDLYNLGSQCSPHDFPPQRTHGPRLRQRHTMPRSDTDRQWLQTGSGGERRRESFVWTSY